MTRNLMQVPLLVVGAGIMGAGIAQVAAQAGHQVYLFDARNGAAAAAVTKLESTLAGLVAKGKLTPAVEASILKRVRPVDSLSEAMDAQVVIEAIVEDVQAKRALLADLEAHFPADTVLATNTSSISVTVLANGMRHPERLVGMHFFNPVPLMKLVEVVSGLHTDPEIAHSIFALANAWGKVAVYAKSTPGFIVNRVARPYYAEALALLSEQATSPAVIDACLRSAGFRMGPCELMDLIGHDTNFAVTRSVCEANFGDKRYIPSGVQRDLVDGGFLGRKSGRGFYDYRQDSPVLPKTAYGPPSKPSTITLHGKDPIGEALARKILQSPLMDGVALIHEHNSFLSALQFGDAILALTDGREARELAWSLNRTDVAVFDRPLRTESDQPISLAYAVSPSASETWKQEAAGWLALGGVEPHLVQDSPGLVVARTVAMLINEAADAVQQGVCTVDGANDAMKLGVNYPQGPFEWLDNWSVGGVNGVLDALDSLYRGERYRVSPWLRRRELQWVA